MIARRASSGRLRPEQRLGEIDRRRDQHHARQSRHLAELDQLARQQQREIAAHRGADDDLRPLGLARETSRGSPPASARSCRPRNRRRRRRGRNSRSAGSARPARAQWASSARALVDSMSDLKPPSQTRPGHAPAPARAAKRDAARRRRCADFEKLRFSGVHGSIALMIRSRPPESRAVGLAPTPAFVNRRRARRASASMSASALRAFRPRAAPVSQGARSCRSSRGSTPAAPSARRSTSPRRWSRRARARWSPPRADGSPANCRRSAAC